MLTLSLMLFVLAGGPTSSQSIGVTTRVSPRAGPTIQAARAGMSAIDARAAETTVLVVQPNQRKAAVAGAVLGGVAGLWVGLTFTPDSGGEVSTVILIMAVGALVGFISGALIAGPG